MSDRARTVFSDREIAEANASLEKFLRARGHALKRKGGYLVGPCPICGGDDRFNLKLATRRWYCRGCSKGGGAIDLTMLVDRLDFVAAVKLLLGIPESPTIERTRPNDEPRKAADDWWHWWREAVPIAGTIAELYLRGRGILELASDESLRFHPHVVFGKDAGDAWRFVPCLLGLVRDAVTDKPIGLQRIGLTVDGRKLERLALGTISGGAVKLNADVEITTGLVIAEGVETALAAAMITWRGTLLRPIWSLLNAGNLERFPVLSGIETLTIVVDNDESRRGQEAAAACAKRWCADDREVIRLTPRALS